MKLWMTKENVEQSLKKLEDEINLTREVMSPIQVAKFILFAGRNKYRNSLNFFQEDKEYKVEQHELVDKISKPTKKVKREEEHHLWGWVHFGSVSISFIIYICIFAFTLRNNKLSFKNIRNVGILTIWLFLQNTK